MLFFPRLGCPSFGLCFCFPKLGCPSFGFCYFAKTWLSKFWFMLFFQDLVVQVLAYVLVLPRLGCPSFGFSCARLHGVRGGSTGQHQTA